VRYVRVTDDLWTELETYLPEDRPGDGTPSLHDFASTTLVEIQQRFAEEWEQLAPRIIGRADYRVLIGSGRYVARYAVDGVLAPDGHIDLISISLELRRPADDEGHAV
jgi:hypothetical protein